MQTIVLVTGITGVGKSSFLGVLEGLKFIPEHSVTPQKIAGIYKISEDEAVQKLIDERRGFTYELTLQSPKIEKFLEQIKGKDCSIICHFIGLESDTESVVRAARQEKNVLLTSIFNEYQHQTEQLKQLLERTSHVQFWDNTRGFRVVGSYSDERLLLQDSEELPQWIHVLKMTIDPEETKKSESSSTGWNVKIFDRRKKANEEKSTGKSAGAEHKADAKPEKKTGNRAVLRKLSGRPTGDATGDGGENSDAALQ